MISSSPFVCLAISETKPEIIRGPSSTTWSARERLIIPLPKPEQSSRVVSRRFGCTSSHGRTQIYRLAFGARFGPFATDERLDARLGRFPQQFDLRPNSRATRSQLSRLT